MNVLKSLKTVWDSLEQFRETTLQSLAEPRFPVETESSQPPTHSK